MLVFKTIFFNICKKYILQALVFEAFIPFDLKIIRLSLDHSMQVLKGPLKITSHLSWPQWGPVFSKMIRVNSFPNTMCQAAARYLPV